MANSCEEGTPALYKYQGVKYFSFAVRPGESYVLTADPWSFLQSWLQQGIQGTRGPNKLRRTRAFYYARLAQDFYASASGSRFPIKGTLCYYGMLNLVKTFLSVKGVDLEKTWEHHGLSLPIDKPQVIQITTPRPTGGLSVFAEFANLLDKPIRGTHLLKLEELVTHIPELHEMAYTLDILPWDRRKFLPVNISFLVNEAKNKLFTEISFEKKNESRVETERFYKRSRKQYFFKRGEESGRLYFRSNNRKSLTVKNMPTLYKNIQKEYEAFDLCSIMTRSGYNYYCDLRPPGLHQLSYSLALLFYIGSIARYRPSETEAIQGSKISPIISEAMAVLPSQFLYQMVSMITSKVCVIPQSKID